MDAPLDDPFLSRQPCLELEVTNRSLKLRPLGGAQPIALGGELLDEPVVLDEGDLMRGAVLTLGRRIALCIHLAVPPSKQLQDLGFVGHSDVMNAVRTSTLSVADLSKPVLIRGETGTGKELVANAIVANGARKNKPFVPVNIAALPPQLVAAEIFGHEKGAFTDAARERNGYFHAADGGTLFLDEIGLAPPDVQSALLRVLETGQVQRLGGNVARHVDVRVLAATDSDLLERPERGQAFSPALLHRLSSATIRLPALRERPQDLGLLLLHFLRDVLAETHELGRLETPIEAKRTWLDARIFAQLAASPWPGNVRQLRNFATELAISSRGNAAAQVTPALLSMLGNDAPSPQMATSSDPVDHDRIAEALARNDFQPARAARALRVSRNTIYEHMRKDPNLGLLSRLSAEEFHRHIEDCDGDLREVARRLQVSYRAVQLRFGKG
jgi:two-component system nitrogen regulation response regulator GlnG